MVRLSRKSATPKRGQSPTMPCAESSHPASTCPLAGRRAGRALWPCVKCVQQERAVLLCNICGIERASLAAALFGAGSTPDLT
ncbi:hypothetical protein RRG08_039027 [Elysia crispata]|uniref:Uncharacterized protein n=1 Tax=Elysia crispata TaxID=231223 RepID=A0AAE1AVQ5_9GAST|nr:hypothetical protein RRG08_039027 [Elysia crispata]